MNDNEGQPVPAPELNKKFNRIETALIYSEPRSSVTTNDRHVFDKAKEILQENGIKPVTVRVTAEGFDPRKAIEMAVREGIGEEKAAELSSKYGEDYWVDDAIDKPDDAGVDFKSFVLCVEVDNDVQPDNQGYSAFANDTRGILEDSDLAAVLYAPEKDQIHTEFRVIAKYIS